MQKTKPPATPPATTPADRSAAAPQPMPYIGARDAAEAQVLIDSHGMSAAEVAAIFADQARDRGNVIGYCRWRQIERLIVLLTQQCPPGTIH